MVVSLGRANGELWPGRSEKARPAGRKPGLSGAELRRIVQSLQRGPNVLGFDTRLRIARAVAGLVTHEYRVKSPRACFPNPGSAGGTWWRPAAVGVKKKPKQIGEPPDSSMKTKRAFASLAHVGTAKPHFRAAISRQCEDVVGAGRDDSVEFPVSRIFWLHQRAEDLWAFQMSLRSLPSKLLVKLNGLPGHRGRRATDTLAGKKRKLGLDGVS